MADHVVDAIRTHGSSRWLLLGHSMGGKVATTVAARTLDGSAPLFGLLGVALLAASPPDPEPMNEQTRDEMIAWADDGPLDDRAARRFIDANVGAPLSPADDALAVADLQRTDPRAWTAWLHHGSREDLSAAIGHLDAPALIIAGGADGPLGEAGQRAHNLPVYPRARLVTLDGAGHLLPLERAAEVAAALLAFAAEIDGCAPAVAAEVAPVIASDRTSARTRGILARRALPDDAGYRPRALTADQLATLRLVADVVLPQHAAGHDSAAVDLAARLDAQLAEGGGDGWRFGILPPDLEAYALALDALADLGELDPAAREERLRAVAEGRATPSSSVETVDAAQLAAWFEDAVADLTRLWVAHPATLARIGFDGFATGGDGDHDRDRPAGDVSTRVALPLPFWRQGFTHLGAGERDPWEPASIPATAAPASAPTPERPAR